MIRLHGAGRTDTGRVRGRNEDAVHVDSEHGLVVVADGMGGHPAGHVASRLALESILSRFGPSDPGTPAAPSDEREPGSEGGSMAEAVRAANRRILDHGREHPDRKGLGTTLTVLRLDPGSGSFVIGHVGDSRAYRMRDGALEPLTHDHTPLYERVREGRMTREDARVHPLGHVLSQALGTRESVDPQIVTGTALPGDVFLLCTDGLLAVLPEERIELVLRTEGASPEELADRLVEETNAGGAPDNVTVALLEAATPEPR